MSESNLDARKKKLLEEIAAKPNIIIVESSVKIDSVEKYAGEGFKAFATGGHICDLPSSGDIGFDRETLEMHYELTDRGKIALAKIRPFIKGAKRVILATDPDREGEAISAALHRELNLGNSYERARFQEITLSGIQAALAKTDRINENVVFSQNARRILDRDIGWRGTAAVSNYIANDTYPMGRVQSQAVAIIARRDNIIANFKSTEHFDIRIFIDNWFADLDIIKSNVGNEVEGSRYWLDKEECKRIAELTKTVTITDIETKQNKKEASLAFKTSTMHQTALSKFGFNSKKTDSLAQSLFEKGHITYIRTDSTALSDDGYKMIVEYAKKHNLPLGEGKRSGKQSAVAQEGHEAIRPTSLDFEGEGLTDDEKKLYMLIFNRAVSSQLAASIYETTVVELVSTVENKDYYYYAKTSKNIFKGYLGFSNAEDDNEDDSQENDELENPITNLSIGQVLDIDNAKVQEKATKAPPHFNEGSLGKYLEANAIGRPGTYTSIYQKIVTHGYVELSSKGKQKKPSMICTKRGHIMVKATEAIFSIMEEKFSRRLEEDLDEIANGRKDYAQVVHDFFDDFTNEIAELKKKPPLPNIKRVQCEVCQSNMIRREYKDYKGKYYYSCTNNDCGHMVVEIDGRPQTLAEKKIADEKRNEMKKASMNEDGTYKYHCDKCKAKAGLMRWPFKKPSDENTHYWRCSNAKCGHFYEENFRTKTPAITDEEKHQLDIVKATNPDGTPKYPKCLKCKGLLLKIPLKKDGFWFKCLEQGCGVSFSCDEQGNPFERKFNKPDWLVKAEERSKTSTGAWKWSCEFCGTPVLEYEDKDGKGTYKRCSSCKKKPRG